MAKNYHISLSIKSLLGIFGQNFQGILVCYRVIKSKIVGSRA